MLLYLDIYLFNWTNHEQFSNKSIKPRVQQLGPYRFRELPDKDHIKFHPHNSTVSYRRLSHYWFDAKNSNGSLDDVVVSLNIVALVSFYLLEKL